MALSSRNVYLSPADRLAAPTIFASLEAARQAFESGERDVAVLMDIGRSTLAAEPQIALQYWEIRHPHTLAPIDSIGPDGALVAVAARLGSTRLIDNLLLPAT